MNTLPIMLGVLCVFALAYRYYSAFLAAKALVVGVVLVVIQAARRCIATLNGEPIPVDASGPPAPPAAAPKMGCC